MFYFFDANASMEETQFETLEEALDYVNNRLRLPKWLGEDMIFSEARGYDELLKIRLWEARVAKREVDDLRRQLKYARRELKERQEAYKYLEAKKQGG